MDSSTQRPQEEPKPKIHDWDVKVKVWQRQARGDNLSGIRRHFELNAGEDDYPELSPDRDTLKHVCRELSTLSPELLRTLPPEVQAHAQKLNPELGIASKEVPRDRASRDILNALLLVAHHDDLTTMARRVLDSICIPRPEYFWVFDPSNGEHCNPDGYGFLWVCRPSDKDIKVEFFNFTEDSPLESETVFASLISHMPEAGTQFQRLKDHIGSCIRASHKLLLAISTESKQAVLKVVGSRVSDAKSLDEFAQAKLSERTLPLIYDEAGALVLYRDFFTTVYDDAITCAASLREEAKGEYSLESDRGVLRYGYHALAMGADSDMQSLVELHKELVMKYGRSQLAQEIVTCFDEVRKADEAIRRELRNRILKRAFSGTCNLCPD